MNSSLEAMEPRRGRPRKFGAASRAITLTLPEEVIAALDAVDHDLSRAVVRVTQPELGKRPHPPAELSTFGRRAVIVVNPSRMLEQRTGIVLVPLADGRALISFSESMTVARLELVLRDSMEEKGLSPEDAEIFGSIADLLRSARRAEGVELHQRNIIVLESTRPARRRTRSTAPKRRADGRPT